MTKAERKEAIQADLYRFRGSAGTSALIKALRKQRSFQITFWLRWAQYYTFNRKKIMGFICRRIYKRVCQKYHVDLPVKTKVGKGLIIYHCYGLVVHEKAVIGDNCMLAHQVTLAFEKGAAPVIGNQVRIAPGAKVVGGVSVGDNVVVGTNAVVVKDVPSNAVTVGIPNKILNRPFVDEENRYYWKYSASNEAVLSE
ncbi:MAG: serine acetyltransferase [Bacteroidia bacterium]|nr:serine acetyltransferase [Bacteroidia bacterium]